MKTRRFFKLNPNKQMDAASRDGSWLMDAASRDGEGMFLGAGIMGILVEPDGGGSGYQRLRI